MNLKASLALALVMTVLTQNAFASDNGRPAVLVLTAEQSAALNAKGTSADSVKSVVPTPVQTTVAVKPAVKLVAKPAAKPAAKPTAKPAAKPAAKVTLKPAVSRGSVLRVSTDQLTPGIAAPKRPTSVKATQVSAHASKSKADKASEIFDACMSKEQTQKKSAIVCLNNEISKAETLTDSAEVRAFNCAELRKLEKVAAPSVIDTLIRGRKNQLVTNADNALQTELKEAGSIGPRKTREIQLRATLNHLAAVEKLGKKVCNAEAFTALLSK